MMHDCFSFIVFVVIRLVIHM